MVQTSLDAVGEALGVYKDASDGVVGEGGALGEAGNGSVVADGETLVEGFVDGETQHGAQRSTADEEEGGQRSGVYSGGTEEAQLLKHGLSQQGGLVDDVQGSAVLRDREIVKGGADDANLERGSVRELVVEIEEQLPLEAGDAGGGVGEMEDQVAVEVERGREGAHGGSTQSPGDLPEPNSPVTRPKPYSQTRKVSRAASSFRAAASERSSVGIELEKGRRGKP